PPASSMAIRRGARLSIAASSAACRRPSSSSRSDRARHARSRRLQFTRACWKIPPLLEGFAGIGAPDFGLADPALGTADGGVAPVAIAFVDGEDDAGLQFRGHRSAGLRFVAHVDEDLFALASHPRCGKGRALAREKRLVYPAFGAVGVADPP